MQKKSLVQMKMIKMNLNYTVISEIIVIVTEKFRGAAHSICNLTYKTPKEIPIVFQNGYTYD